MRSAAQRRAYLGQVPLFTRCSAEELDQVAAGSRSRRLARGEVLFHAGEESTAFFVVVTGQVKLVLATPDGAEKILEIVSAGETFGEAVMFIGRPYPVTAQSLTSTSLISVPAPLVLGLIDADPGFARRMLAGMAVRLHRLVGDVAALTLSTATQRVANLLLSQAGDDVPAGTVVRLPAAKAALASRLGLTPETFSRVLRELSDAGVITVSGAQIRLLQPDVLRPTPLA